MSELLVQRLKSAKRELTALKTAHRRGLGGLKVYEYPLEISGYNDHVYVLNVEIMFASDATSFPFITCSPQADPSTFQGKADVISMYYTNNGMGVNYSFDWFALTQIDPYTIYFLSTAPIESVVYQFVRPS